MPASWAYILRCADGSYYTGCTTFLEQRYGQHQAGTFDGYTSTRRPVVMVWAQELQSIDQAIFLERQIKGWSRAKKEALIRGEFDLLPLLSRSAYKRSGC
jgi:predicted GIY-YIG superfamily endonuclease